MDENKIRQMNILLVLAYIGDAVFELYVRKMLVKVHPCRLTSFIRRLQAM